MNDKQLNWCNTVFATNLEDVLEYGIAMPDVQKQMEHQYHLAGEQATAMLQAHEAAIAKPATRLSRPDGSDLYSLGRCIICLRSTVSLFA